MKKQQLSEEFALKLLAQISCSEEVIEHCKVVADLAYKIAKECKEKGCKLDIELVKIGALLHDVGRVKTHEVNHNIMGAQIVKDFQMPSSVILILERHVGGGISQKEAQKLGWPIKNYIPKSLEERIVCYADKLVKGTKRIPFDDAIRRLRSNRNVSDESIERLQKWHDEFFKTLKIGEK